MSDEKYVVELQDKIDGAIPSKLEQIAEFARSGFSAVERLQKALQAIDSTAVSQLALANLRAQKALNDSALSAQRLATETQRTSTAAAAAASAQAKLSQASSAAATATARLATEQARTATQTANASGASDRAALAALRLSQAQNKVAASASKAGNALGFYIKSALSIALAVQVAKTILADADAYTVLQNKLQNVSTSQRQVNDLTAELFELANRTRQPIDETTSAFTRFDRALKIMGKTQEDSLRLTETVNKALVVSGATAGESASALLQLSQAFNSGRLQGDEFRAIAENMPLLLDAIAKSTGKPITEIKKMSTEGKITAKVLFDAFKSIESTIDETFGKTVQTLSQGMAVAKNNAIQTFGEFNKAIGFTRGLANAVVFLSEHLKDIGVILITVGGALAVAFAPAIAAGILAVVTAAKALMLILIANPIIAFAAAISYLVAQLVIFKDESSAAYKFLNALAFAFDAVGAGVRGFANFLTSFITQMFNDLKGSAIDAYNTIADIFHFEKIKKDGITEFKTAGQQWAEAFNQSFASQTENGLQAALKKFITAPKTIVETRVEEVRLTGDLSRRDQTFKPFVPKKRTISKDILDESEAYIEGLKILVAYDKELKDQSRLMQMLPAQREIEQQMIQISNQLAEKEVFLRKDQAAALREQLIANQQANAIMQQEDTLLASTVNKRKEFIDQLIAIKRLQNDPSTGFTKGDAAGATSSILQNLGIDTTNFQTQADAYTQVYNDMYAQIATLREMDLISEQEAAGARMQIWAQQQATQLQGASSFFAQLSQLSKSENKKIAAIGKAAAITGAIIDTYKAATGAYASLASIPYVGPVLGAAAAAAAIVAGMANVQAIKNQSAGFMEGGYTGNIPRTAVAGPAHGQEYVMNATSTKRIGVANLNAMQKGGMPAAQIKVSISNYGTSKTFETEQISADEIRIIARDEASKQVDKRSPDVISNQIQNPNSKVSKALNTSTTTGRRR